MRDKPAIDLLDTLPMWNDPAWPFESRNNKGTDNAAETDTEPLHVNTVYSDSGRRVPPI